MSYLDLLDIETIPSELKSIPQWIVLRKSSAPGRVIDPKDGKIAFLHLPGTWGTFTQAIDFFNNRKTELSGIAFVFSKKEGFVGIDLDLCRNPDTGEITDWALEIVKCLDSYTEISPSGTGLHIIADMGQPPRRKTKLLLQDFKMCEKSSDDEFIVKNLAMIFCEFTLTMTGAHLDFTPCTINVRPSEIRDLYRDCHQKIDSLPIKHPCGEGFVFVESDEGLQYYMDVISKYEIYRGEKSG